MTSPAPTPTLPRRLRNLAATLVVVALAAGAVLTAPLTATAAPVKLSGVVTGPTGTPAAAVNVEILSVGVDGTLATSATVKSSAAGLFTLPALPAGSYTLRFGATSTTFTQFLGKTSVATEAQVLDLVDAAGGTPWIAANLAPGGTVRGTVKTTAGKAVSKYTATAYSASGESVATAVTSAKGVYSFAALEPGAYRIGVADATSATPRFAPVFSGPAASLGQATPLSVVPSQVTTQNFSLGTAGRISGVLRGNCPDADCLPGATTEVLPGVTVTPVRQTLTDGTYQSEPISTASRITSATGAFNLTGLAPGRYVLRLAPKGSTPASGTVYGERYFGGADSPFSATTFTLGSGTVITGLSDTLDETSTLSATFTDSANTGESLANIRVRMSLLTDPTRRVISEGFTDASGTVVLTGAGTGGYQLSYGSHSDSSASDGVVENTVWQGGQLSVYSYSGSPVVAPVTPLSLKDPLGLHPLSTLFISTTDPSVGGYATIAGGINSWNSTNVSTYPQWLRNGVEIPGATHSYYTFRAADAGAIISVRITARNAAYGSGTVVTDAIPFIGFGTLSQYQDPTMTGSAVVGATLTVNPALHYAAGAVSTITWQRTSSSSAPQVISGETGRTHVVTAADLDYDPNGESKVNALVTVTRQGYTTGTYGLMSDIVTEGEFVQSKAAAVKATTNTFTAQAPALSPTPAVTEYLWTVFDATGAPAANSSGPTLARAGKAGKKITLTVRSLRPGYATRLVTLVVQNAPAPVVSGSLAITGTPMVDSPLVAPVLSFTPALDKNPTYQWSAYSAKKWKNIAGATQATFTPTSTQKAQKLRVVITGASTGFMTRTVTSISTTPVAISSGLGIISAPVISGQAGFNRTVTVSTGSWSPNPTSYGYQWKVSTDGTNFAPIAGATKASYTMPDTALGKTYAVTVTANRAGYASISTTVQTIKVHTGVMKNLTPPKFAEVTPGHWKVTDNGTWSHPTTSFEYLWLYSDPATGTMSTSTVFFNSTSTNQTPFDTSAEANTRWGLIVRAQGPGGSYGDSAPLEVRKGKLQGSGTSINDAGNGIEFGETVSAATIDWQTFGATTKSYQWQISSSTDAVPLESSWTNLAGATKVSLATTLAMVDKQIRLRATGQAPGYLDTVVVSPPMVVQLHSSSIPTGADGDAILGSRTVGSVLTYKPAKYAPGWTVNHEWWTSASGAWLKVATGGTFTPATPGLVYVKVTATRTGYATLSYNTAPVPVSLGVIKPVIQPVVTKSAAGAYSVTTGSYSPAATVSSYRWTVTSATGVETNVSTAGPVFTPDPIHDGKLLLVELTVTSTDPMYPAITIVKVARAATSTIEWTSEPYLNGGGNVGQTLEFTGGTWTMPNPTLTYQWRRNGVPIVGATAASYSATSADISKTLSLSVTASKTNFGSATTVVTASSVTLSDFSLAPTAAPSIVGTAVVGGALGIKPGTWNKSGLTISYRWMRNGAPIPGATGATYTASAADYGQDLSVEERASKAGYYNPFNANSSPMHVGIGTFATEGSVEITSPPAQFYSGKPISSAIAGWAKNATLTYQWEHSPDGTFFEPIVGATGKTFTATPATAGYTRLTVTGKAPGYTTQVASTITIRINP
jgi:hypothetical protein